MGDHELDEETAMMWQDALDEVAAGRPRDLRCPFCTQGEVSVSTDEQTKRTRLAERNDVPRAEREKLLLAQLAILEAPEFATRGRNLEVEPTTVPQSLWFLRGLGISNLDVG